MINILSPNTKKMIGMKKFLQANYAEGTHHTHVSLIQPKGAFILGRKKLEEFWKLYCDLINNQEEVIIGIAEKSQTYMPILVDIDLKIKVQEGMEIQDDKLYTDEEVNIVIQTYQSVIRKVVEDCKDEYLTCVLLEKEMSVISKDNISYYKHGFHLHFPFCFLNKNDQEAHIIPRVKDILNTNNLFKRLGYENADIFLDNAVCKVPWLLYGSRKSENSFPYKISKIFDHSLDEISIYKAFKGYLIFDDQEQAIPLSKENIQYNLPRILSIFPYGRTTLEIKHGIVSPLKEKMRQKRKEERKQNHNNSVTENINDAKRLISMLTTERASDRNNWMDIGWILYNISEGSVDGLDIWIDFSKKCEDKFDEGICIAEWDKMIVKDKGMGSLKYYAKIDNPQEYQKFKDEQTSKYIQESLSGSHNDIAKILFAEYSDEFVCASVANKTWYQFISHKWELIDSGVTLSEKISDIIVQKFTSSAKELFQKLSISQDKAEEAMLNSRIKQVQKMIGNLKNNPFKRNVMNECAEVFYDKKFLQKLDSNPRLIAFKNGVMELKPTENIFRAGCPEDYISKCLPFNYIEFEENDEKVQEVRNYLEKVFPDKSIKLFFIDTGSDSFVGGNHQKKIYIWTGEGDNAKSVTQLIFEKMFGELAIKFNTSVVTGKKPGQGAANADLSRTGGGIRWAVFEEPDPDELLNIGTLKHLSGNDSYFARDLHERGKQTREIKPMYKLIGICNDLPKLKYNDKAIWNRIRVIPFESTFCEDAPETYEEQLLQKRFPVDKDFSNKLDDLIPAFAWVLLKNRIDPHPRVEPEKVKMATSMYQKQNDVYRQFIEEMIIDDSTKSIYLSEIYVKFKEWIRESMPAFPIPIRNEVEKYLTKVWGTSEKGKKWLGHKFSNLVFKKDKEKQEEQANSDSEIEIEVDPFD